MTTMCLYQDRSMTLFHVAASDSEFEDNAESQYRIKAKPQLARSIPPLARPQSQSRQRLASPTKPLLLAVATVEARLNKRHLWRTLMYRMSFRSVLTLLASVFAIQLSAATIDVNGFNVNGWGSWDTRDPTGVGDAAPTTHCRATPAPTPRPTTRKSASKSCSWVRDRSSMTPRVALPRPVPAVRSVAWDTCVSMARRAITASPTSAMSIFRVAASPPPRHCPIRASRPLIRSMCKAIPPVASQA